MRKLALGLGIIAALSALTLIAWMAVAGPVTVLRVLRYGDTQIDDFQHYPAREMSPSPQPYRFPRAENIDDGPLAVPGPDGTLTDLDELLAANDSIAFLVLKDGRLVIERYYQGHSRSSLSQSFSMAKSFTSILVGIAIAEGVIRSPEQRVTDFAPELADSGFAEVRLRHLLTMTSGSDYVEDDNPFGEHVILNYTDDLEGEILEFERVDPPGEVFRYKSGDNALAALILSRALAPTTITEYMQEKLWNPLGMEHKALWSIDHEGDGLEKTWCCLAASPVDYLKLGQLYLQEGMWQGDQVVPQDWVEESTRDAIPEQEWDEGLHEAGLENYGYWWWLVSDEEGGYLANGKDGQYLYINPSRDAVVLRLGWSTGDMGLRDWLDLLRAVTTETTAVRRGQYSPISATTH